ncbi:hypothetical protein OBBRIDRAFT_586238 [Obba rivulosa]|uniref:Senescence domain-containing protein n=1 Tax=Obba rivulosa TaxID=1052685 RepID=A0A8E2AWW2_9APHY|nr:hypothetical protein OBBRIDRAFT_586238 [Obba rivulosa]
MTSSAEPSAFTLLTIPDVVLSTPSWSTTGTVALECITLSPQAALVSVPNDPNAPMSAPSNSSAVYLVLKLGDAEFPVDPAQQVSLLIAQDGTRTYTFFGTDGGGGASLGLSEEYIVRLAVPPSSLANPQVAEDVETFDHVLTQYANVTWETDGAPQSPEAAHVHLREGIDDDLRGRLILMDDASGEVVAQLPESLRVTEDPALAREDEKREGKKAPSPGAGEVAREADPVVLELPPDVYDAYMRRADEPETGGGAGRELRETRELLVRAIPPEEQDWLTKSASFISYAIDTSTSLLASGITAASSYYITHSAPASASASGSSTPVGPSTAAKKAPVTPSEPTMLTSPRTHAALAHAHNLSAQAARASARTAAYVEGLLRRAVGGRTMQPTPAAAVLSNEMNAMAAAGPQAMDAPPPYAPYVPRAARATGVASDEKADPSKPPLPRRRPAAPPLPPRLALPPSPQPPGAYHSPDAAAIPEKQGDGTQPRTRQRERALLSLELVLASADDAVQRLFDVGSARLGDVMGHKYGPGAAHTTHLAAHTARNVVLVYIDVRGFARRALVRKAGKEFVKAQVKGRGPSGSGTPVAGRSTAR